MGAVRVLMLLVGLAAIAAGCWFCMKGRSDFADGEEKMGRRWGIWQSTGAIDETKLATLQQDAKWQAYKPTDASTVATPFHHEFGSYLRRIEVQSTRAAMALGGVGLAVILLGLAAKPRGAPPA